MAQRKVYKCHGCGRPLRAGDLARNSTTHWDAACMAEAIRRSEVRQARREGIPVAVLRARYAFIRAA